MSYFNPSGTFSNLLKEGFKHYSGAEEAILKNIDAIKELGSMTRTSYGPNGMNKFIVNQLEKLFLTKDSATMLRELDINHPAARIITNSSKIQDGEMGDNTNFVITYAAELLNQAAELIKNGLHPSEILIGYEKGWKKCLSLIEDAPRFKVSDVKNTEEITKVIRPVIGSKLLHGHDNILAPLIAEACIAVVPAKPENFNVDNIRVAKILGGSLVDSQVIHGLVVVRNCETATNKAENCKIAIYNCPLETQSAETKDTVLFKTADELINYNRSEEDFMEKLIKEIVDAGVKVVIAGGSISDMALHYFERYKIMVFRIMSKFELRRIAKAVGATPLVRLGAPTKEEIGFADKCYVDEISSMKCIVIVRESDENKLATLVIRGSTFNFLENIEGIIEDGVNVYRNACKDPNFVPGAGAIEMFLSNGIKNFGKTVTSLDQYAIKKFGEAFEVVPRTLAENSGLNVNEVLANLYTKNINDPYAAINIKDGEIGNAFDLGVYDHLETKKWAIKFAVDAVLTILRVDQPMIPTNSSKYKTMLCKHFETNKGCSFGDKCQFAHGAAELRPSNFPNQSQNAPYMQTPRQQMNQPKKGPNPQNFKIVKCKYWEKDGTCRYGSLCTFAHGDNEMRSKNENMMRVQQQMYPFMDMSNPMMSPMGMSPFPMGMMNPFMMQPMDPSFFNNPENSQSFDMNTNMPNPMNFNPMANFNPGSGNPGSNLPTNNNGNNNS